MLTILTKLKIRIIIVLVVLILTIFSVLFIGMINVSANAEITSIIECIKNCDAIGLENSLMGVEDNLKNSMIQDRKKIMT